MAYSDKVIDHYKNPRNVGSLNKRIRVLVQGWLEPLLWRRDETANKVNQQGIIEEAKFKTYGCGSAIASRLL